jgi:opine dehydrogenase
VLGAWSFYRKRTGVFGFAVWLHYQEIPVLYPEHSVAVLGAGHSGLALAGYLSLQGYRVAVWNRSWARVAPIAARGGIELTLPGEAATFARISIATTSMAAALASARCVLVAVPAFAHADIARRCAPYLREGHTVLLLPGRTCGALEFQRALRQTGNHARITLGEASTFPFASRCNGPGAAVIYAMKAEVRAAALPATRTSELLTACEPFLPMLSPASSVLETSLANVGAILHPVITLLNADRIARGESFDFYTDGVTPSASAVLAAADDERLRIGSAYGVQACSLQNWIAAAYGHRADTLHAALVGNSAYVGIKAPPGLKHRYLLEDVPTGLIPLIELGEAAGVACPMLRAVVSQARAVLGGERWRLPRTLDVLGLQGLGIRAIRASIEWGLRPISVETVTNSAAPSPCFGPVRARAMTFRLAREHSNLARSMSA